MKADLDKLDDQYLGIVHRMIEFLEKPSDRGDEAGESWEEFLASCYGSLADAPIERGEQGEFEVRDLLR